MEGKKISEYVMGELVKCAGEKYGIIIGKVSEGTYHVYMSEYGAKVQRYEAVRLHKIEAKTDAEIEVEKRLVVEYKALQNQELSNK